jgi:hypothetical protein
VSPPPTHRRAGPLLFRGNEGIDGAIGRIEAPQHCIEQEAVADRPEAPGGQQEGCRAEKAGNLGDLADPADVGTGCDLPVSKPGDDVADEEQRDPMGD